jgi:Ca-activated chloride channel family protein
VLILLTDGANNVGEVAPRKAAELARDESIKIHTIGVGNDQLRVPGIFGSRMVNPSADLDEDALRDIAAITGGQYYRARNTQSLMRIYTQIDALEPVEQESETYRPIRALYFWPAGLSFILYCLLVVMDSRRRA